LRELAWKIQGKQIAIELFVAVLIGALLGMLGPFGTYRMDAGPRMVFWIFTIVAGLLIFRPTLLASDWLAAEAGMPEWLAQAIALLIGSLPMTLLVSSVFHNFDLSRALRSPGLAMLYGNVLLISVLTNLAFRLVLRQRHVSAPAHAPVEKLVAEETRDEPPSRIAARLPAGFGPLLALNGEDHYVRVHSPQGSTLILIRLRDAIAELDPALEGMQVHRSWWVARNAVASHRTFDRALRLVLTNGLEVPVARDRIAPLKAAGWIKP
jgi:hypothetical protein